MSHSYRSHYFHLVWSTHQRKKLIHPEMKTSLYCYIAGVIKNFQGSLLAAGGVSDHIHLLIELKIVTNYITLIRDVKSNSALWVKRTFPDSEHFKWQEGYSSFSVSYSGIEGVRCYIDNQEMHHKYLTFEEEYLRLLRRNRIDFDDRFVLG